MMRQLTQIYRISELSTKKISQQFVILQKTTCFTQDGTGRRERHLTACAGHRCVLQNTAGGTHGCSD